MLTPETPTTLLSEQQAPLRAAARGLAAEPCSVSAGTGGPGGIWPSEQQQNQQLRAEEGP